jgi:hypothetical protein
MSIAEVPEGRQRSPYLVSPAMGDAMKIRHQLKRNSGCRLRGPNRSNHLSRSRVDIGNYLVAGLSQRVRMTGGRPD